MRKGQRIGPNRHLNQGQLDRLIKALETVPVDRNGKARCGTIRPIAERFGIRITTVSRIFCRMKRERNEQANHGNQAEH